MYIDKKAIIMIFMTNIIVITSERNWEKNIQYSCEYAIIRVTLQSL